MEARGTLLNDDGMPAGILTRTIPDTSPHAGHAVATIPDFQTAAYPEPMLQSRWQFTGMVASAWLAANTSNYSWPTVSNYFLENIISWGVTWVYFEATYFIYYACNTNWDELVGRVRSEYRNHAGWGSALIAGKVVLASLPPVTLGLFSALIKSTYSVQIQSSLPAQIICLPPISRIIDATLGLPVYMLSWKVINKVHPVKPYRYTYNAPLHPLQRVVDKGVRAFNSTSVTKFAFTIYRRFGAAALLHHPQIPLVVGAVDAGLFYLDSGVANMVPNHPFKSRRAVNLQQVAAVNADIEAQTMVEVQDDSIVERNAMVRGRIYSDYASRRINSTGGKIAWNIGIVFFALGMVVIVNVISNVAREDKETLSEPFYTGYLLLLALVSQFSRLLFQSGVPYLVDKVTSCCATKFSQKKPSESTALIAHPDNPTATRLSLTNNQEDN